MTEQENSDHWKLLAHEVGAELPAEVDRSETEPSSLGGQTAASADERRSVPLTPSPKRPPRPVTPPRQNHWGLLAGELGIDVPQEPKASEGASVEMRQAERVADQMHPHSPSVTGDELSTEISDERLVSAGEAVAADPPSFLAESVAVIDEVVFDERPRDEREGVTSDSDDSAVVELHDQAGESPVGDTASGDEPDRPRRRRRRRRRRGSRKATDDAESGRVEPASVGEMVAEAETIEEDTLADEDHDFDEESASDESAGQPDASDSKKHTKIPTWEEAVNFVISANLEARSRSAPSGGRRVRGRGRRGR